MSEWSDWYVYRIDGPPMGPLTTRAVAEAILASTLPTDAWICAPGGGRWVRAADVPAIAALLEGIATRRRGSGMRIVTAPMPAAPAQRHDDTIRTTNEPEPTTMRSGPPRGTDGFPIPPPPPSSSSPRPPSGYRGGDTLESPFDEPARKKTLGR